MDLLLVFSYSARSHLRANGHGELLRIAQWSESNPFSQQRHAGRCGLRLSHAGRPQ